METPEDKAARLRESARLRQQRHRRRQKAAGLVEVKLRVKPADAALLRDLARAMRRGEPLPLAALEARAGKVECGASTLLPERRPSPVTPALKSASELIRESRGGL